MTKPCRLHSMAGLIPIIVLGSIASLCFLIGIIGCIADEEEIGCGGFALFFICGLVAGFLALAQFHRVPEDHIRVLHRSGEPFMVLKQGIHYIPEFIGYNESNFSCRPRQYDYGPGKDTVTDGTAKWAEIGDIRGNNFYLNAVFDWSLKCDAESIIRNFDTVKRDFSTTKAENKIFLQSFVQHSHAAIKECAPHIEKQTDIDEIESWYATSDAEQCVMESMKAKAPYLNIYGVSDWQVRYNE